MGQEAQASRQAVQQGDLQFTLLINPRLIPDVFRQIGQSRRCYLAQIDRLHTHSVSSPVQNLQAVCMRSVFPVNTFEPAHLDMDEEVSI